MAGEGRDEEAGWERPHMVEMAGWEHPHMVEMAGWEHPHMVEEMAGEGDEETGGERTQMAEETTGEGDEEAGWERPQMVAGAQVGGRAMFLLSLLQVIVACVTMGVEILLVMGVGGAKHRTSLLWVAPFTSTISVFLVLCRYRVDNNPMMTWFGYAMTVGFSVLHIVSSTFHLLNALNSWKLKNFLINYPLIYAVCVLVSVIINLSCLVERG